MNRVLRLIEGRGVQLRKHKDYAEGVLTTDDFMAFLLERRRMGDADFVYLRGNDDVLEVTFLDESDVGRAAASVRG